MIVLNQRGHWKKESRGQCHADYFCVHLCCTNVQMYKCTKNVQKKGDVQMMYISQELRSHPTGGGKSIKKSTG